MKNTLSKREHILLSAVQVVLRDGVAQLTLDTVAIQAQVSKGGLLYHFPSKEALISAMLSHYMAGFEARLAQYIAQDTVPIGRFLRAFVLATLEEKSQETSIVASAMSALAHHPSLLEQLRAHYAQWHQRALEDGISDSTVQLVMLATDGWWYAKMFGNYPQLNAEAIQKHLFSLIESDIR